MLPDYIGFEINLKMKAIKDREKNIQKIKKETKKKREQIVKDLKPVTMKKYNPTIGVTTNYYSMLTKNKKTQVLRVLVIDDNE